MARGNEEVQQRLFDRMDMLLNIQGAEGAMAEALTEVNRQEIFILTVDGVSLLCMLCWGVMGLYYL